MNTAFNLEDIKAIHDHIVVQDMNFDIRVLNSGIVLLKDDKTTTGIRPRWAKVCLVGSEQTEIKVGQWVLVEHGRWTRGIEVDSKQGKVTIRRIDADSILAISDTEPNDESMSTAVHANAG